MNEQLIVQLQLLIELAKTGEEFDVIYPTKYPVAYLFKDNKLHLTKVKGATWTTDANASFNGIVNLEIIRKPWKPKVGEKYWRWDFDDSHEPITSYCDWRVWGCDVYDLTMYAFGNCFRTKEECELHPEVRDKLIAMRKEYE